jgi:16S rRNA processing protein RimM
VASAADEPELPDDGVEVGRIVGAWGVRGAIKVKPFSAEPEALFSSKRWFLRAAEPALATPGVQAARRLPSVLRVAQARAQGEIVVAQVHDLQDRDAAQALAGARVFVARSSFPTPGADEFYWVDLIGLAVRNREGVELGTICGLVETGPSCVLRVQPAQPPGAAEVLIPFVGAYVDRVDLSGRCVHVDWQPDY